MKRWFVYAAAFTIALSAGSVDAKKPKKPRKPKNNGGIVVLGGSDLVGESFSFKSKCKGGPCQLKNFTFRVKNQGDVDMPNSRVEFWLSNDIVLDTVVNPITLGLDVPIHTQSLGKVKAGKTKKRTVGGGHLKQIGALPGQYIIAVVNPGGAVEEVDILNNTYASVALP